MDSIANFEKKFDRELGKYPIFLQLERVAGINKARLVLSAAAVCIGLILFRYITDMFTAIVVFAYPAVMTVAAIESSNKSDDVHWLTYWMVVTGLNLLEMLTFGWLSAIIPFYALFKLAFCVWLFMPHTRGASLVYQHALRPIVMLYRDSDWYKSAVSHASNGMQTLRKSANAAMEDAARSNLVKRNVSNASSTTSTAAASSSSVKSDDDYDDESKDD